MRYSFTYSAPATLACVLAVGCGTSVHARDAAPTKPHVLSEDLHEQINASGVLNRKIRTKYQIGACVFDLPHDEAIYFAVDYAREAYGSYIRDFGEERQLTLTVQCVAPPGDIENSMATFDGHNWRINPQYDFPTGFKMKLAQPFARRDQGYIILFEPMPPQTQRVLSFCLYGNRNGNGAQICGGGNMKGRANGEVMIEKTKHFLESIRFN